VAWSDWQDQPDWSPALLRCRDVAGMASDLMEGGLPLSTRFRLRLHLAMCVMCRNYMDQMRRTRALLARRPITALDPDAEDALIRKLQAKPE
jgi:hypothetical protein